MRMCSLDVSCSQVKNLDVFGFAQGCRNRSNVSAKIRCFIIISGIPPKPTLNRNSSGSYASLFFHVLAHFSSR